LAMSKGEAMLVGWTLLAILLALIAVAALRR
jgi:hypothetical protein